MTTTKKQRLEEMESLLKDFETTESFVVAGYGGIKTPELNELRGKLRPLGGKCRIVKNTLIQIALKNKGINDFEEFFKDQSAIIFQQEDAIAGLKVLVDFQKAHKNLQIRAGYMEGQKRTSDEIKAMAALPSREILLATLLYRFNGPLTGFVGVLSAPMRYLASALDQVAKQKEAGEKK